MPSGDDQTYIALWYRALRQELGTAITVRPEDKRVIVNRLYEARKLAADPELDALMVILPGGLDEIWIHQRLVALDD